MSAPDQTLYLSPVREIFLGKISWRGTLSSAVPSALARKCGKGTELKSHFTYWDASRALAV